MAATCGNGYVFDKLLKKKKKCSRRESNSRPLGPESNALTTDPPEITRNNRRRRCLVGWCKGIGRPHSSMLRDPLSTAATRPLINLSIL